MTKKERHKYSKLIKEKLLKLGIKDHLSLKSAENGDVTLTNPLRNLIRNLRKNASKEEIEVFLKSGASERV